MPVVSPEHATIIANLNFWVVMTPWTCQVWLNLICLAPRRSLTENPKPMGVWGVWPSF